MANSQIRVFAKLALYSLISVMVMRKLAFTLGVLILLGGGCVLQRPSAEKQPEATMENKDVTVIEMTANGFNPPALTIKAGTTVKFENKDNVPHWPASGVHPTHEICRGFDARRGVPPGESYLFTFTEVKTCPMHDHLNPSMRGSITVEGE